MWRSTGTVSLDPSHGMERCNLDVADSRDIDTRPVMPESRKLYSCIFYRLYNVLG